jgi:hypothetical protein
MLVCDLIAAAIGLGWDEGDPNELNFSGPWACSCGWWLMAGADLFLEKSTAGWLLVAGLF